MITACPVHPALPLDGWPDTFTDSVALISEANPESLKLVELQQLELNVAGD